MAMVTKEGFMELCGDIQGGVADIRRLARRLDKLAAAIESTPGDQQTQFERLSRIKLACRELDWQSTRVVSLAEMIGPQTLKDFEAPAKDEVEPADPVIEVAH